VADKYHIEIHTECGWERFGLVFLDLQQAGVELKGAVAEGLRNIRLTDDDGKAVVYVDDQGAYRVFNYDAATVPF